MKVIGICGMARAGKDTVADYIADRYGYKKFVFSDVLKDELLATGKEATKENMAALGNELRTASGADVLAKMLFNRAKGIGKVCAVGFRSPEEVEFFRKNSDAFFLIEVRAGENKRESRAADGGRDNVGLRDKNDIKAKGLDRVFSLTDATIENDSTLEALYLKADKIMKNIEDL